MRRLHFASRREARREFVAGMSIEHVAWTLGVSWHQVEDAIRCELRAMYGLRPLPWKAP